jgi:hypothetical protein
LCGKLRFISMYTTTSCLFVPMAKLIYYNPYRTIFLNSFKSCYPIYVLVFRMVSYIHVLLPKSRTHFSYSPTRLTCHRPYNSSSFDCPKNIWRGVSITKLLITQFSPVSCYFLPLKVRHLPQHIIRLNSLFRFADVCHGIQLCGNVMSACQLCRVRAMGVGRCCSGDELQYDARKNHMTGASPFRPWQ